MPIGRDIQQIILVEFRHVSINSCANSPVILTTISRVDIEDVQNSTRMWKIKRGAVLENRNDHWSLKTFRNMGLGTPEV